MMPAVTSEVRMGARIVSLTVIHGSVDMTMNLMEMRHHLSTILQLNELEKSQDYGRKEDESE